jgi:hypothetical protein
MSGLGARLHRAGVETVKKTSAPVWDGPESVGPRGGVTQSMLSRWLCCRERFRLRVVEGLRPTDTFNHRIEYGQMWHTCEEAIAKLLKGGTGDHWKNALTVYCQDICRGYPLQQEQIVHWMNVCKTQFPLYISYWAKHPDVKERTPLLQEQVFDVPYSLPSGRIIRLRGKWDSVDLIGKGKNARVYLQENKTKGDIVEEQLKRQLGFDLQTMIYLVALNEYDLASIIEPLGLPRPKSLHGIRYNVVRRPLSGGKGSIRKHQPTKSNPTGETDEEFYARLGQVIMEDPAYYFMRWQVEVTQQDVLKFRHQFLDNALEELCDWWYWINSPAGRKDPFGHPVHFRLPYGIYNPLLEGGSSEVDEYLASGSELGLTRDNKLFTELA